MNEQRLIDANALDTTLHKLGYSVEMRKVVNAAPTIEPKRGEWISVKERLPEEGANVLLTFKNSAGKHVGEAWFEYDAFWYIAETNTETFREQYPLPLYWMPLPMPPKE